jgi:hypothetical protein
MRKALGRCETVKETTEYYGKTMSIEYQLRGLMRYIGGRGGGCEEGPVDW